MKRALLLILLGVLCSTSTFAQAPATGYTAGALTKHQQFTREIYKQLIEINSADKTG